MWECENVINVVNNTQTSYTGRLLNLISWVSDLCMKYYMTSDRSIKLCFKAYTTTPTVFLAFIFSRIFVL